MVYFTNIGPQFFFQVYPRAAFPHPGRTDVRELATTTKINAISTHALTHMTEKSFSLTESIKVPPDYGAGSADAPTHCYLSVTNVRGNHHRSRYYTLPPAGQTSLSSSPSKMGGRWRSKTSRSERSDEDLRDMRTTTRRPCYSGI